MVLDTALLNSQHYKVRIKGKVECGLKVDFNNVNDSDNPVARVSLRNTPCFNFLPFPPWLFL